MNPRRFRHLARCLSASLLLFACTPSDAARTGDAELATEDGTSPRPLHESFSEWQSAPQLTLSPTQRWCATANAAGCDLRGIDHAIALPDGGIVLAAVPGPMYRHAADARSASELAAKGQGPGEYGLLVTLALHDERVVWVDNTQMRIASIGLDNVPGPVQALQMPQTLTTMDLVRGELVVLDVPGSPTVGDTVLAEFRTVPLTGEPRVLGRVRTPSIFLAGSNMAAQRPFFTPRSLVGVGWNGDVAQSNGGSYELTMFPSSGRAWQLRVDLPSRDVTVQERDSVRDVLLARDKVSRVADLSPSQQEYLERTGRTVPPLTSLRVLRDGTLWVRLAPAPAALSARWDVFAPDGARVGHAQLPLTAQVTDGERAWILVVERDDDDVPSVVRYDVAR